MIRDYSLTQKQWIWLSSVPEVGPRVFTDIISEAIDISYFFSNYKRLIDKIKIPARVRPALVHALENPRIDEYMEQLDRAGIYAVCRFDPDYPHNLLHISSPPTVLYVSGDISRLDPRCVSVVGTRSCSHDGYKSIERLSYELARAGVTVVSGMAKGIDCAAHSGALLAGGTTIAVLAGGVDVIYPSEHRDLYADIARTGAVISEMPPGTPPTPVNFSIRNRLIAGISPCLLVGEAPLKSGSSITAKFATDYDRTVFVTATSDPDPHFMLANSLYADGCQHVACARAIMSDMLWTTERYEDPQPPIVYYPSATMPLVEPMRTSTKNAAASLSETAPAPKYELDVFETCIYNLLRTGPMGIDDIVSAAGRSAGEVIGAVTMLEIKGAVSRLPGNVIRKK